MTAILRRHFSLAILIGTFATTTALAESYSANPAACPLITKIIPTRGAPSSSGSSINLRLDSESVPRRVKIALEKTENAATVALSFKWTPTDESWGTVSGQFLLPADGAPHCFFLGYLAGIPENSPSKEFEIKAPDGIKIQEVSLSESPSDQVQRTCPSAKDFDEVKKTYKPAYKASGDPKIVGQFVQALARVLPRYDCRREFDYLPIPAYWLCGSDPSKSCGRLDVVQWFALLSNSKVMSARKLLASEDFRSSLSGEMAEDYEPLSLKAAKSLRATEDSSK